ncbi:MAG: recombinase family protein [candidate division Zixibacteria bacterium]|nr:recombinase family protein [candidate division Zixibacteria bacterium]
MSPLALPRRPPRRGTRVESPAPAKQVRAAIYCRKSTDENLHLEFNSLDAQRESCAVYIASMKSEGWIALPEAYSDAAQSGGTTDRPALQRLLADIGEGKVDAVVVVKIDRMSRSLIQFLQLMEYFEEKHVSFVAVTQQINTASSAGRLLINVLVSFAQFEREIGSERTREKIHAARKKGRYTGGHPPLGYDIDRENHRLVVNTEEAEMVRELFDLYLDHRSLLAVAKVVNARGWTRKSWLTKEGIRREGRGIDKVYIQRLLTNQVYLGLITLHDEVYPGLHEAIVNEETFRQVGSLLVANRNCGDLSARNKSGALLRKLLRCGRCGSIMAHAWTRKGGRVYSYYACNKAQKQSRGACPTPTLSAGEIEATVVNEIRRLAQDPALVDQVFSEALEQTQQKRLRLESERTRLLRQRQQREEAISRLVSTLEGRNGELPEIVTERIKEREAEVAQFNGRLLSVERELATIGSQTIDREHLAQTLAQFTDLWDALYPAERIKLVQSLVETIVYHDEVDRVEIRFRLAGDISCASTTGGLSQTSLPSYRYESRTGRT